MAGRCSQCGAELARRFAPMEQWGIEGPLCGACYSRGIAGHYPGGHARTS